MATYWITFRLADVAVGGRDYNTRYKDLVEAVKAHRSTHWWFEPTSFWLINSNSSMATIAAAAKKAIAPTKDLVLIGSNDTVGVTLVGAADKLADLKALVPHLSQA